LKFGVQLDYKEYYSKHAKLGGQKGRGLGHATYFKFWDPKISPARLKLET